MNLLVKLILVPVELRLILQDINLIAQIVGIIMIVLYVFYTYKTFRQIKKQTDYQQDAYLTVDVLIMKDLQQSVQQLLPLQNINERIVFRRRNPVTSSYLNTAIPMKMTDILKPLFRLEDSLYEGNYFTLCFTNYGNAEIKLINITLILEVSNSVDLVRSKMLREKETHNLKFSINELVARNGGKISVPLIATASFPIFNIIVNGEYLDFKNKKYQIESFSYSGENTHFHSIPK